MTRSSRRRRRWFAIVGLALLLVLGTGFAYLRIKLEGPDLGDKLASILNKRMRGRIEIGSIEWPTSALKMVVTGGWVPVTVRDVKVWDDCALSADGIDQIRGADPNQDCTPDDRPDPDPSSKRKPRKLLLATPELTGEIDLHAAMFGRHDLVFRNVVVHGGEALIEQTREPYPLHAYKRTIVSIITAFYPRMKAGFRDGIYADKPPPIFDLRDIHIERMNLTVHIAPYSLDSGAIGFGLAARIDGVDLDVQHATPPTSYLYMDPTDPLVQKFYVRLSLHGQHARLRLLDEGPRAAFRIPGTAGLNDDWAKGRKAKYELELSEIAVNRLAQLPTDWPRHDFIANTLEVDLTAHTVPCNGGAVKDGADLHFAGELKDYWDRPYDGQWNFGLDVKNFGPTLRSCIKSTMGGDNLGGRISITGPFVAAPKVTLDLHDLDYDVPLSSKEEPVHLTLAEVHGEIDLVNDEGSIERTKALVEGGKQPGEIMLSARFGLKPLNACADVDITKPIDVGRFLPARAATSVGRYLSGHLRPCGDPETGFDLTNIDLALGPTPKDRLVRVYDGRLFANNYFEHIELQHVRDEAGQTRATLDGGVEYTNQFEYRNLRIDGRAPDLNVWLERFGLPPVAMSADGGVIILNGPVTNPKINVQTTLAGIPCIDTLRIDDAVSQSGIIEIRKMSTAGLGGTLTGDAKIDVTQKPPVVQSFRLTGSGIDASKLCGLKGSVKGTLETVEVGLSRASIDKQRPVIDWFAYSDLFVQAKHLNVLGDDFSDVALCVNDINDERCRRTAIDSYIATQCDAAKGAHGKGFCAVTAAQRDRGGKLDATVIGTPAPAVGRQVPQLKLGGVIALEDLPMAVLDPLVGPNTVGGLISGNLALSGTPTAPQAQGAIDLLRGWVGGAFVGDSQLEVDAIQLDKMPGVILRGTALAGQLGIVATLGTQAPYPVDVSISGRRIEVDPFMDLQKKLGLPEPVQAWASGTVTLHTELAPKNGKPQPEAWVEVTELEAIVDHRAPDGRQTPLRFALVPGAKGQYAMSLRVTPSTLELACRDPHAKNGVTPCKTQLETPAGIVSIAGNVNQAQMDLNAAGDLDLAKLGPLLETQLDSVSGALRLTGTVNGTLGKPLYSLALDVKTDSPLRFRPIGGDTEILVPSGQIKLASGAVGFNSVVIKVRDERHPEEEGQLVAHGSIALDGFTPTRWGVLIDGGEDADGNALPGKLAGKMLLVLAPGAISQASGLARLDGALVLSGAGPLPLVDGTIVFDPLPGVAPLAFIPRAARRELALLAGSMDIGTTQSAGHRAYELTFRQDPLVASIDGEGKIENIHGSMTLRDGSPSAARIELDAENLPFRSPTLELAVSARDITLELPDGSTTWRVSGDIAIVNGSYKRNFDLTEVIKPAPPTVAPAKPVWDEYPTIGNAELDLVLDVRRFAVENNIAHIDLAGPRILIAGTPRDPRLSGSIRVSRGDFKLPGTRAAFTRTTGTIDFADNVRAANPKLDITSDADFIDLQGQQHTITLTLAGTLEQPNFDLKTNTGLDKSQTLALLLLGRNPEQLRRSLGDSSLGTDPTRVDPTTNPSTGFADQIVKDLAGDWVSDLLSASGLSKILPVDVIRFEIGFGSAKIHAETKLVENVKAVGEGELTIRGRTANANVIVNTPLHLLRSLNDGITIQGSVIDKSYIDTPELNYSDAQAKFAYKFFIFIP